MALKRNQVKVIKQNVGVDISKDDFKVCFYHLDTKGKKYIKGTRTFKNTLAGFLAFMEWIEKKRVLELEVWVTVEATGVYYENLVHFLDDNGYFVSVILPNQSKAYAKSLNLKTKTDKVDAKMLGQLGIERDLMRWQAVSVQMRLLKQLTRDRVSLLEEKVVLNNKLHALDYSFAPHKAVIKRMKQRLKLVVKQISEVEKEVQKAIQADELLHQKVANICKIKGLGLVPVGTVIAETNGFVLFTSRSQLTSYSGFDVVERESGTSIKGKTRISKKGNRQIRRALYFPAISAVKHEPEFKNLFERILKSSGIKMKAYVAVQRKLLLIIYTLFKNNSAYDPNYQIKKESKQNCRQEVNPAYSG